MNDFLVENNRFQAFSLDHLLIILLGMTVCIALIAVAVRSTPRRQVQIGAWMGYIICAAYFVIFILFDAIRFGFDPAKHFPFAMCNVCGVTIWLVLHRKNYFAYEILFFWIMSGTLAAVITPENRQCFPHYSFFAFWTIHMGLVISAIYATVVYRMRPTLGSVFKSFFALNAYAAIVGLINLILLPWEANYFYLCHKPDVWTPLNWFGPWPWYIFLGQLFALSVFLVLYSPFWISNLISPNKQVEADDA